MKICLLDLNYTLVGNQAETRTLRPFSARMEKEEYRLDLLEKIRKEFDVILIITARPEYQRRETMNNIKKKTGWLPHGVYFNKYNLTPPECKERALKEYVFPKYGRDVEYFAVESNPKTRSMYSKYGINAAPYSEYIKGAKEDEGRPNNSGEQMVLWQRSYRLFS